MQAELIDFVYARIMPKEDFSLIAPCISYDQEQWAQGRYRKEKIKRSACMIDGRGGRFLAGLLPRIEKYCLSQNIPFAFTKSSPLLPSSPPTLPNIIFRADQIKLLQSVSDHQRGIIKSPTGCLTGDTQIRINRCTLGRTISLLHLYKGFNRIKTSGPLWDLSTKTYVRSFNGSTIQLQHVIGVTYSGKKETFKLDLTNGLSICATSDHPFLTRDGWKKLKDLAIGESVMCDSPYTSKSIKKQTKKIWDNRKGDLWYHPFAVYADVPNLKKYPRGYTKSIEEHRAIYEAKINGLSLKEYLFIIRHDEDRSKTLKFIDPKKFHIHHKDENHRNNDPENLEALPIKKHKKYHAEEGKFNFCQGIPVYSQVKKIAFNGIQDTYDIHCPEHHNFAANDIIVHNSGKTVLAGAICSMWPKSNILFLCHTIDLLTQSYDEFVKWGLEGPVMIGGKSKQKFDWTCDNGRKIVVATIQTFVNYDLASYPDFFDIIILDEAHHLSDKKNQSSRIFDQSLAPIRIGLTATPPDENNEKERKAALTLEGFIGPIIGEFSRDEAVGAGIIARPLIDLIPVPFYDEIADYRVPDKEDPMVTHAPGYADFYKKGIIENRARNRLILSEAFKTIQKGESVLILIATVIDHGHILQEMAYDIFDLDIPFIYGETPKDIRRQMLRDLEDKKILCLIANVVWKEGVNVRSLNHVINAAGQAKERATLQRIGRGQRATDIKKIVRITDFLDPYKHLAYHCVLRMSTYAAEGWLKYGQ